jgi:hypothetical protein
MKDDVVSLGNGQLLLLSPEGRRAYDELAASGSFWEKMSIIFDNWANGISPGTKPFSSEDGQELLNLVRSIDAKLVNGIALGGDTSITSAFSPILHTGEVAAAGTDFFPEETPKEAKSFNTSEMKLGGNMKNLLNSMKGMRGKG